MAGEPGNEQDSGSGRECAGDGDELRDRALLTLGTVDPQCQAGGEDEQPEHELEVGVPTAEGGVAQKRNERTDVEG